MRAYVRLLRIQQLAIQALALSGVLFRGRLGRLADWVQLLRPRQMSKNLLCFAGVLFSGRFDRWLDWERAGLVFLGFAAASSAVYIFNDIHDIPHDRLHPRKRYRPLARGDVSVFPAALLGLALGSASLAFVYTLGMGPWICLVLYLLNNVGYSRRFKFQPIVDVLSIAVGFVLRLLAGVYVLEGVIPTAWITLCTFFLTVFLGFAKRRAELASLGDATASGQRPVLSQYTVEYLDSLLNISVAMAVICYALFTTTGGVRKSTNLVLTVPIVFFALLHYQRVVMLKASGEQPESLIFKDWMLLGSILLWLATYFWAVHSHVPLFE